MLLKQLPLLSTSTVVHSQHFIDWQYIAYDNLSLAKKKEKYVYGNSSLMMMFNTFSLTLIFYLIQFKAKTNKMFIFNWKLQFIYEMLFNYIVSMAYLKSCNHFWVDNITTDKKEMTEVINNIGCPVLEDKNIFVHGMVVLKNQPVIHSMIHFHKFIITISMFWIDKYWRKRQRCIKEIFIFFMDWYLLSLFPCFDKYQRKIQLFIQGIFILFMDWYNSFTKTINLILLIHINNATTNCTHCWTHDEEGQRSRDKSTCHLFENFSSTFLLFHIITYISDDCIHLVISRWRFFEFWMVSQVRHICTYMTKLKGHCNLVQCFMVTSDRKWTCISYHLFDVWKKIWFTYMHLPSWQNKSCSPVFVAWQAESCGFNISLINQSGTYL